MPIKASFVVKHNMRLALQCMHGENHRLIIFLSGDERLKKLLYVMIMERTKTYNKINKQAVTSHVEYLRNLDEAGKLELCGPLKGYPGVAGMIILKAESYEEAAEICKSEPLFAGGYTTYKLSTLEVADRENNYLL